MCVTSACENDHGKDLFSFSDSPVGTRSISSDLVAELLTLVLVA